MVGFVDYILNKQVTHFHFFHSYVLFKIQLGLYEGLAFLPWFETKKLYLDLYAARFIRSSVYTRSYTVHRQYPG